MGKSLPDTAASFSVLGEWCVKPERPSRWEGRLDVLPAAAAAVQPLAGCPVQLLKGPRHWCSLPRFPCCCWAVVPEMGLNRTISSLLCGLPLSRRAVMGGRKGLKIILCLLPPRGSKVCAWPHCMQCNSGSDVAILSCFQGNKWSTEKKDTNSTVKTKIKQKYVLKR